MNNPSTTIIDLTLSSEDDDESSNDQGGNDSVTEKRQSLSPPLISTSSLVFQREDDDLLLPRKKRPKLCASKTVLSKVSSLYRGYQKVATIVNQDVLPIVKASSTTEPKSTTPKNAVPPPPPPPPRTTTSTTSTTTSTNTTTTTLDLDEYYKTPRRTTNSTQIKKTECRNLQSSLNLKPPPQQSASSPYKVPYQHVLFSHDTSTTATATTSHNNNKTPSTSSPIHKSSPSVVKHDPLFEKDPILSPQEMEVIYLGVESMYCLHVNDFDWGFVYEHASESLRIELRQDTALSHLIRMNDVIVRKRYEWVKDTLLRAMTAGYRRPAMAKLICDDWRKDIKHSNSSSSRLRQNFTKWFE